RLLRCRAARARSGRVARERPRRPARPPRLRHALLDLAGAAGARAVASDAVPGGAANGLPGGAAGRTGRGHNQRRRDPARLQGTGPRDEDRRPAPRRRALRNGDRQGAPGVRPVRQRGAPADAAGWDVEGDPPQMAGPVRADARAARGAVRRLMDARALDDELPRLAGVTERVRANLLEMELDPGRQLIAMSTLEGETAGRWAVANTALGRLWAWLELLDGVLASARTERGTRPRPSAA